eukprot:1142609-Pelagomonas_calceolata.AAC.5
MLLRNIRSWWLVTHRSSACFLASKISAVHQGQEKQYPPYSCCFWSMLWYRAWYETVTEPYCGSKTDQGPIRGKAAVSFGVICGHPIFTKYWQTVLMRIRQRTENACLGDLFKIGHDNYYSQLEKKYGADGSLKIAGSMVEAIGFIERIVQEEKIQCGFTRLPGYLFPENNYDVSPCSEGAKLEETLLGGHVC